MCAMKLPGCWHALQVGQDSLPQRPLLPGSMATSRPPHRLAAVVYLALALWFMPEGRPHEVFQSTSMWRHRLFILSWHACCFGVQAGYFHRWASAFGSEAAQQSVDKISSTLIFSGVASPQIFTLSCPAMPQ